MAAFPTCSICHEMMSRELSASPCGHVFHAVCLRTWTENVEECPECRHDCPSDFCELFYDASGVDHERVVATAAAAAASAHKVLQWKQKFDAVSADYAHLKEECAMKSLEIDRLHIELAAARARASIMMSPDTRKKNDALQMRERAVPGYQSDDAESSGCSCSSEIYREMLHAAACAGVSPTAQFVANTWDADSEDEEHHHCTFNYETRGHNDSNNGYNNNNSSSMPSNSMNGNGHRHHQHQQQQQQQQHMTGFAVLGGPPHNSNNSSSSNHNSNNRHKRARPAPRERRVFVSRLPQPFGTSPNHPFALTRAITACVGPVSRIVLFGQERCFAYIEFTSGADAASVVEGERTVVFFGTRLCFKYWNPNRPPPN